MSKIKVEKYKAEVCPCCSQSTTYLLGLDKGSAETVQDILKAISTKGINEVHPARELNWKDDEKWKLTNLSRPRFHGLIAFVKGKKGFYCLTKKAGKFLRGEAIPRYAIISKVTGHQEGYWQTEQYQATFKELFTDSEIPYWEGAEKRMLDIIDPVERQGQQTLSFNFVLRQN